MTLRQERINSLLREISGSFIREKINYDGLITVLDADISSDLKNAKIFISVFPEKNEEKIIKEINNNLADFKNYAKNKIKIKFMPSFVFEIDKKEKQIRKIEELLKK